MMPDQDSFWDELLAYIEAHSVVPIVGPELVIVEHDGRLEPYHRLLARELTTRLKVGDLGEGATLDQVVGAYLAKPGSRRQSVYRELGDIAGKLSVEIPEPLLQLASIRDLNLYVSFSTDNLLAQAINAARFSGRAETRELSFNPSEAGDLPDGSRDVPLVYSLFGRISVLPKYVVAEEDELEWVTALQIPEKRPERLFDELGRNSLLFLGCRFPDWLARFIIRTAKNTKLSTERGFSEYLVDADVKSDSPLVAFLTSFSRETQVLALDPLDFVAELAQRWQQRQGGDAAAKCCAGPKKDEQKEAENGGRQDHGQRGKSFNGGEPASAAEHDEGREWHGDREENRSGDGGETKRESECLPVHGGHFTGVSPDLANSACTAGESRKSSNLCAAARCLVLPMMTAPCSMGGYRSRGMTK